MKRKFYFAKAVLRTAGQSLQLEMNNLIFWVGVFAGVFSVLAISLFFIIGGIGVGWGIPAFLGIGSLVAIRHNVLKFEKYYQGREGERSAREEIEPIIKDGYHILNDVPGHKFNIDIVVIGPSGIYAIEVKNPKKYSAEKITYNDGFIFLGHRLLHKPEPVEEAKRHANWIKSYLREITGRNINNVKPVVLFPKIMIEDDSGCVTDDIWILNPKRFRDYYLPRQNKVLEPREVQELVKIFRTHIYDSTPKFDD